MWSTRSIAFLLSAGLLLGAAPVVPREVYANDDYARREAESAGLEDFRGGFHGVVVFVVLAAAVATVIYFCVSDCVFCSRHHPEVLPPAEARPRPAPSP